MREPSEEKKGSTVRPHTLSIDNRQRAVVGGVEAVDSFNEQTIVLVTSAGAMVIFGEQLHISKLNLEDGQLLIEGQIHALEYDDRARSGRQKFGKLFK